MATREKVQRGRGRGDTALTGLITRELHLRMVTGKSPTSAAEICPLTSVESKETLITQHFLKAVEAVLVHQLPDHRASATLVLHPGLHQIYGIHRSGPHSYKQNNF